MNHIYSGSESVTCTRKYRGWTIATVQQSTGRKTWDIFTPAGDLDSQGYESLSVAKACVDAELDSEA